MKTKNGFALPTVMITSVVMLAVLLTGLVYTSSTNVTVRDQYYDQLAREAAESGLNTLVGCLRAGVNPTGTYTPQSTSCSVPAIDNVKSNYVMTATTAGTLVKTTFTAVPSTIDSAGYYTLSAVGTAQLFRTSNSSTPVRTISKSLSLKIQAQSLFPSATATGVQFVCALLNSKNACWGTDAYGEHGDGGADTSPSDWTPTYTKRDQTGSKTYPEGTINRTLKSADIDVGAGSNFACVLSTNDVTQASITSNTVHCWGSQLDGRLGNEVNNSSILTAPMPVRPVWKTDAQYPVQITAGGNFACVRTNQIAGSGNIFCWGNNGNGQMGNNSATPGTPQLTPTRVRTTGNATSGINLKYIQASTGGMCGITPANVAVCWGDNTWSQTGTNSGSANNVLIPKEVLTYPNSLPLKVKSLSLGAKDVDDAAPTGSGHGCAISNNGSGETGDADGKIWCWGSRQNGETAIAYSSTPAVRANVIPSIKIGATTYTNYYAEMISSSWRASCALIRLNGSAAPLSNRHIYCWGNNMNGELGINLNPSYSGLLPSGGTDHFTANGSTNKPQPIYIEPNQTSPDYFSEAEVSALTQGGLSFRFCALAGTNNYCWGANGIGQVGDGTRGGDFAGAPTNDPLVTGNSRFYPRLSVFSESPQRGLTY